MASSAPSYSPLPSDHAPASLFFQKGPPGCTRKTSSSLPVRRKGKSPALRFVMLLPADAALAAPHETHQVQGLRRGDLAFDLLQCVLQLQPRPVQDLVGLLQHRDVGCLISRAL